MLETFISPLIEPVSETDLVTILRTSLDSSIELTHFRLLTGGLFNTSYYITTRHPAHQIILRIAPPKHKHDTLFDHEKRMMAAEPAIYDLLRDASVPVPDVLAIDTSCRILPRQYILLQYLDTVPMNSPDVPESAQPALRQQLGIYLKRIHQITRPQFGWIQPDGTLQGHDHWHEVFSKLFNEVIRRCRQHNRLDEASLDRAAHLFTIHAKRFDDPAIKPALVHSDVWDANILLEQVDDSWQIAAIIDADRALLADRELEPAIWDSTPEFNQGYDWPLSSSFDSAVRRQFYQLYHALFHVFVFGVQIPEDNYYDYFCTLALSIINDLCETEN